LAAQVAARVSGIFSLVAVVVAAVMPDKLPMEALAVAQDPVA
jgi:hypothetical protein